ncbi:lysozyme inhibitor LprI family protein [Niallia sp.]|uniref:lysozyme inhibitor LprI family protein n=1 Tax=Niallia sp. TaxID=2837523 RepID=UPI0028A26D2F|nr:lysozyme inhibitor LprI family protein [Niallia sp.]
MKKYKTYIVSTLLVILLIGMTACSNSSDDAAAVNQQSKPDHILESSDDSTTDSTNDSSQSNDSSHTTVESSTSENKGSGGTSINNSESQPKDDTEERRKESLDNIQKELDALPDKIEGNKKVFIERLDNIQKELDTLPDKEGSDSGATNAMKNYYGVSYEQYDKALNAIYTILKKELSPQSMKDLNKEQLKWIEQKETRAEEERLKYNGGTFENVALYISLYESTKARSYQLVNEFMTN